MDDPRSLESQLLGEMTYDDPRKNQPAPAVDPRLANASAPVLEGFGAPEPPRPAVAPGTPDPRLANASAPVLDTIGAPDPRLAHATAPVLEGFGAPEPPRPQQPAVVELSAEQIGILQSQRAQQGLPPYTEAEIEDLKRQFIERQIGAAQPRPVVDPEAARQQQEAAARLLADPEEYTQPEKKEPKAVLPQVDASALLEEPAPEPERRVTFNQEDIEAAKKQATKRAAESLHEAPAKTEEDQKRARQEMEALRQQQLADLARAGFPVSVVMTAVGIVAGACIAVFGGAQYADPESLAGFFPFMNTFYVILGAALALLSITVVLRVKPLKGFLSFCSLMASILLVVPGLVCLPYKSGTDFFPVAVGTFVVGLIGGIVMTFMLSTNDKLNAYYDKKDYMYD